MISYILKESPEPIEKKGEIITFKRRKTEDNDISNFKRIKYYL